MEILGYRDRDLALRKLVGGGKKLDELFILINSLFGNGEAGLMFLPGLTYFGQSAKYLTSAGSTPVDSDGDPFGLGLDVSQKLALGPELVTNGGFDTDLSGWETSGHWQWESGRAYHPDTSDFKDLRQNSIGGEGVYEITFDIEHISGTANIFVFNQDGVSANIYTQSTPGTNTVKRVVHRLRDIGFSRFAPFSAEFYIDNISVRELPGNHLTQPDSAKRPVYRNVGGVEYAAFDGADDYLIPPVIAPSSGDFFISTLLNTLGLSGRAAIFSCGRITSAHGPLVLYANDSDNGNVLRLFFDGMSSTGTDIINTGWRVITLTRVGNVFTVYIDGILDMQFTNPGSVTQDFKTIAGIRYGQFSIFAPIELAGVIIRHGVFSSDDTSDSEEYLAKIAGIQL